MNQLTEILNRITSGNLPAEELLPLVYDELRKLAAHKMAREPAGQTLQATALVHEAWLRLGGANQGWQSRAHFFGAAAEAMRRILVDRARAKRAMRHGGGLERMDIHDVEIQTPIKEDEILAVDEVLEQFAARDPQKAELVKLRYFVGLSVEEAAEVLGISAPTTKRYWAYARAWLLRELERKKAQS